MLLLLFTCMLLAYVVVVVYRRVGDLCYCCLQVVVVYMCVVVVRGFVVDLCYCCLFTGGLLIYDVSDPTNPVYVACNGDDGYVHDAQCVIYNGPDTDYQGNEVRKIKSTFVCFTKHAKCMTLFVLETSLPRQRSNNILSFGI